MPNRCSAEVVAAEAGLTIRQTQVWVMSANGLSYDEIAEALGLTWGAVQRASSRARVRVLAELRRQANLAEVSAILSDLNAKQQSASIFSKGPLGELTGAGGRR